MACDIVVWTRQYNADTQQYDYVSQPMISKDNSNIERNQTLTLDILARLVANMSEEERSGLTAILNDARKLQITSKMVKDHVFTGNITVGELIELFPEFKNVLGEDLGLYSSFNIYYGSAFEVGNVKYQGRVLTAKGDELFILTGRASIRNFFEYLQGLKAIKQYFEEERPFPDGITDDMLKQLDLIAERNGTDRAETLTQYLIAKSSLTPFQTEDGQTVTPTKVCRNIIAALTNTFSYEDAMTEAEIALSEIKNKSRSQDRNPQKNTLEAWVFSSSNLYDTLAKYVAPDKLVKREEFESMNEEEMNSYLFGTGGVLFGNPKLDRASITKIEQGQTVPQDMTPKTEEKYLTQAQLGELWKTIQQGNINFSDENKKVPSYNKAIQQNPERVKEILDGYTWTDNNGNTHNLIATERKGKLAFKYEYTVEPVTKQGTKYITMTFNFTGLGDTYNFGYDTASIFSPVPDDGTVVDGKYKGMYIYRAVIQNGNKTMPVYACSRTVISPGTSMRTFPNLKSALHEIDKHFQKDTIRDNCLLSIKMVRDNPREVNIELEHVRAGQVISSLGIDFPERVTPIFRWNSHLATALNYTVPQFHELFKHVRGITQITTPEQAAAFLVLVEDRFNNPAHNGDIVKSENSTIIDVINNPDYQTITDGIIDRIINPKQGTRYYYVERIIQNQKNPNILGGTVGRAVIRYLPNDVTYVDTGSGYQLMAKDQSLSGYLPNMLTETIDYYNRALGKAEGDKGLIHAMTLDDLQAFATEHQLDLGKKLPGVKAFIFNGEIYVNTSTAQVTDLYHEIAHIFMGLLKVQHPEAYRELIQYYRGVTPTFGDKVQYKQKYYQDFALPDLEEEVVADLIAETIFKSKPSGDAPMVGGLNADFNFMIDRIWDRVHKRNNKFNKNGLGFTELIDTLDSNMDNLRKRRLLTNLIRSKIEDGTITEHDCN